MPIRFLKELRILWPGLSSILVGAALFAIGFNATMDWIEAFEGIGVFVFVFGTFLLACSGFDHEFQQRTLGMLLAQPISRKHLWREKLGALLAALIVGSGVLALIASQNDRLMQDGGLWFFVCVPICAFATGPLYALLTRQALTATILSICVPIVLGLILMVVLDWQFAGHLEVAEFDSLVVRMWLIGLGIYCSLGYLLGCWRMHTLQVVDGGDKHLKLPAFLEHPFDYIAHLSTLWLSRPSAALVRKELGLHRLNFLLAGFFIFLWFTSAVAQLLHPEWPHWEVLHGVLVGAYWIIITMTIGAIAVAEERTMGTHDWHQTLPISTRRQWSTKLLMALGLSVLLAVILPGVFVLRKFPLEILETDWWIFPALLAMTLTTTFVSFYISTINRTSINAVLGVLFVRILTMTVFTLAMSNFIEPQMHQLRLSQSYAWNEGLITASTIGFMTLAQSVTCVYFSYRHFRQPLPGWRTIIGEFILLLLVTATSIAMAGAVLILWLD